MKNLSFLRFFVLPVILSGLFSCSSKTEEFVSDSMADYLPLTPGKYITYRVDSLIFINFQVEKVIHSYQIKHLVSSAITDNEGRPSYLIYRYIRNADGIGAWIPNGSYMITPLTDRVEVTEDNLRFIRLHMPVREGFSWKGNKYLPDNPYKPFGYLFSIDDDIHKWENTYSGINETVVLNQQPINNVISILELDDLNVPDTITIANNKATIPAEPNLSHSVWVKGTATDTIEVIVPPTNVWKELTLFNATNKALLLDAIYTPAGSYEFINNRWQFGREKETGIAVDTVTLVGPVYASRFLSKEKYAKNIGLIQREYELWELQPNLSGNAYYTGFGVKMWMIDHN
jgi:hypothetical protein